MAVRDQSKRRLNIRSLDNSYLLRGEIPPPCCWVESIDHGVANEHQSPKLV